MNVEFVDTNVLIYAHDSTAGLKHDTARQLVGRLTDDSSGALSIQVLCEFYSAVTKKYGMKLNDAEEVITDFGEWTVHQPSHRDVVQAARLHRRYQVSWWDALILHSAMSLGCELLWSEDFGDGQKFGDLTVRNPFK